MAVELIVKRGRQSPKFCLTDPVNGSQAAKSVIGTFIEALAGHFLEADTWALDRFYTDVPSEIDGDSIELEPDLLWRDEATIVECKGGKVGWPFHVHVDQLEAYEWARDRASWPIYRPRVLYALFGYRLPKRAGEYKTVGGLLEDLVRGVECGSYMDLELVRRLADTHGASPGWVGPLSPELGAYKSVYRLTPTRLLPFARKPRRAIKDLQMGGRWQAKRIATDDVMTVAGPLRKFPLSLIRKRRKKRSLDAQSIAPDGLGYFEGDLPEYVPPPEGSEIPF